jgi:hypothetical protein
VLGVNQSLSSGLFARYLNDLNGPFIALGKSRSPTVGAQGIVINGDTLGGVRFYGSDGTNLVHGASIEAELNNNPGTNDMPTAVVVKVSHNGTASPVEAARFDEGGAIITGSSLLVDGGTGGGATVFINGAAGNSRNVYFRSGGLSRWAIQTTGTAESGADAGSNFAVIRFDDAGVSLGTVFSIVRSTGLVTFTAGISLSGGQILANVGTLPLPGITFQGDNDTGLWRHAANAFTLVAGGVDVAKVLTTGLRVSGGGVNQWDITTATIENDKGGIARIDMNAVGGFLVFRMNGSTTESLRLKADGGIEMAGIPTSGSPASAVFTGSANTLTKLSSLQAYKDDITELDESYIEQALALRPVSYRSNLAADNPDVVHLGFIAEYMEQDAPLLATYDDIYTEEVFDENGVPSARERTGERTLAGVAYDRVCAVLTVLVQAQQKTIAALEERVAALEAAP